MKTVAATRPMPVPMKKSLASCTKVFSKLWILNHYAVSNRVSAFRPSSGGWGIVHACCSTVDHFHEKLMGEFIVSDVRAQVGLQVV
jgi:hypothetical protein